VKTTGKTRSGPKRKELPLGDKIFDAVRFLRDHRIPTSGKGRHGRKGWIQIHCPLCAGSQDWHGGFNLIPGHRFEGTYSCYRCGYSLVKNVIRALLRVDDSSAARIYLTYLREPSQISREHHRDDTQDRPPVSFSTPSRNVPLPPGTGPLQETHRRYLTQRNFDPDLIERDWKIAATRNVGEYAFRIIIPVFRDGYRVSYQGRDITSLAPDKYRACHISNEVIHHKFTLYGIDDVKRNSVIVVEGVTDAWRIGKGNVVGTFGVKFTRPQLLLLHQRFDRVFVFFDDEPDAINQGLLLVNQLEVLGTEAALFSPGEGRDPGSLPDSEAAEIVRELL